MDEGEPDDARALEAATRSLRPRLPQLAALLFGVALICGVVLVITGNPSENGRAGSVDLAARSQDPTPWTPTQVAIAAAGAAALALAGAAFGIGRKATPTWTAGPEVGDVHARIASAKPPFSVCSGCRLLIEIRHPTPCPRCGALHTCVYVETDADLALAMASVRREPPIAPPDP